MNMFFCGKFKVPFLFIVAASLCLMIGRPGVSRAEDPEGIEVSKKDCARIVAHQPAPDVDYKPGVDAMGRPVVGADLPGSVIIEAPTKITIPLTLDVAELFALPDGVAGESGIGTIEYDIMSGRLEYNGQPLNDPQMAAISAACAKMKK
ncbi:hypothetical protein [Nisaea sp.]|uniref:hypothetical protein n=1 Tax=Nisaea sp. TaxID=2024842 RepID=UPI0032F037AC